MSTPVPLGLIEFLNLLGLGWVWAQGVWGIRVWGQGSTITVLTLKDTIVNPYITNTTNTIFLEFPPQS